MLAGATLLAMTLVLWQAFLGYDGKRILEGSHAQAVSVRKQIGLALDSRITSLEQMAARISFNNSAVAESEWRDDAIQFRAIFPDFLGIGVQNVDYISIWSEAGENNKLFHPYDNKEDPMRKMIFDTARAGHKPVVSQILELRLGGRGFLIVIPIYRLGEFKGFVNASMRAKDFFTNVVEAPGYELHISESGKDVFNSVSSPADLDRKWGASVVFSHGLSDWTVRAVPTVETLRREESLLPTTALLFGLTISLLFAALIELLLRMEDQSKELERRVLARTKELTDALSSLRVSENRLNAIIDQSPFATLVFTSDGVITRVNQAWFELWDISPGEFQQLRAYKILENPLLTELGIREFVIRAIAGERVAVPMAFYDPGKTGRPGKPRWVEAYLSPIRASSGEIQEIALSFKDVTSQIESSELEVRERAALESSRLKSEFLANMSHEIRTPINGIVGMTRLLGDTDMSDKQSKFVSAIARSANLLRVLVNDILDLSKIEAGKLELELLPFHLDELVRDMCECFAPFAEARGLEFVVLYEADKEDSFLGDSSRLRQILNNLIANAIKFTDSGKVVFAVTTRRTSEWIETEFVVKDTGIGISPAVSARLFKNFTQGDSSTARKFGGTGLGLAICKRLSDLMNGSIELESHEGQGSTFCFRVKLRPLASALPQLAVESTLANQSARKKMRVLVVEDNSINQEITVRMLLKAGYQVEAAANGIEALVALQDRTFDLVLMDCQMPEMDGLTAARKMRERDLTMPVLALTASALNSELEKCLNAGMNDCIIKPIYEQSFLRSVDHWLKIPVVTSEANPAVETASGGSVDFSVLRRLEFLEEGGGDGLILRLIRLYIERSPSDLAELRQSAQQAGTSLIKCAHMLKSSSLNIGARRVSILLQTIEDGAYEQNELSSLIEAVEGETQNVRRELLQFVNRDPRLKVSDMYSNRDSVIAPS